MRGFCSAGASRDVGAGAGVGEVFKLFVDPSSWNRGLGGALLSWTLDELAASGSAEVTVWSFAENVRANAFYERHGFGHDGGEQHRPELGPARVIRYRLKLPRTQALDR